MIHAKFTQRLIPHHSMHYQLSANAHAHFRGCGPLQLHNTLRYNPAGEAKVAHIALRFYGALTLGQAYIVCELYLHEL